MDNAGSFDRLISLLPKSFCYICFDLPGHGKSSHFPPHLPLFTVNNLLVYRLVATHFKKDKYIIMGHSYGGQIAMLFARLYPEYVEKLIMLDCLNMFPIPATLYVDYLRDKLENVIKLHAKLNSRAKPSYTYEEALKKITEGRRNGYVTAEAAKALLPRSIQPIGNGRYEFTIDQRLKDFVNPFHDFRYIAESMKEHPVLCPVLIILGKKSDLQQMYFKRFIVFLKKRKNYIIKIVDGHHDVHNNEPENVAPDVNRFLLGKKAKL